MPEGLPRYFTPELVARAKRITTLVLDVDGVLTDGSIVYADGGDELKRFDVRDGAGLVYWNRAGLRSAIITGRKSRIVKRRAKEMRVDFLAQKALFKLPVYEQLKRRWDIEDAEICVVGDDLMELPLLKRAGLAVTVPNGAPELKAVAHLVTGAPGGSGAVRELIDALLRITGNWEGIMERYLV